MDVVENKNKEIVERKWRTDKEHAYSLYMLYKSTTEIADEVKVAPSTVTKWASEWKSERDSIAREYVMEKLDQGYKRVADIIHVTLPVIHKAIVMRARKMEQQPMTMAEVARMTEIVTSLDKLLRLESGAPTEIHEMQQRAAPVPIKELIEALKKDKFLDVVPLGKEHPLNAEYRDHTEHLSRIAKDPLEEHVGESDGTMSSPSGNDTDEGRDIGATITSDDERNIDPLRDSGTGQ